MKKYFLLTMSLLALMNLNGCGGDSAAAVPHAPTPPLSPLVITSAAPPVATIQTPYENGSGYSLTASGGKSPYMWSWTAGAGSSLPAGFLNPSKF